MSGFVVAVRPWGVFVAVLHALSPADRAEFADRLQLACETAAANGKAAGGGAADWGAVVDLRGVDVAAVPGDRLAGYVAIAARLRAGRVASLLAGWKDAFVFAGALRRADLMDRHRVIVMNDDEPEALARARGWVMRGVEPFSPLHVAPDAADDPHWLDPPARRRPLGGAF